MPNVVDDDDKIGHCELGSREMMVGQVHDHCRELSFPQVVDHIFLEPRRRDKLQKSPQLKDTQIVVSGLLKKKETIPIFCVLVRGFARGSRPREPTAT